MARATDRGSATVKKVGEECCATNVTMQPTQRRQREMSLDFIELTYCEENPDTCQNGAKCVSVPHDEGAYRCLCREGTYGRNCEGSDFPLAVMKPARTNTTTTQRPNIELTTTAKPEKVALVFAQDTTQNGKNYTDNEP